MASLLSRILGRADATPTGPPRRRALTASARHMTTMRGQRESLRRAEPWQDAAFSLFDQLGPVSAAFTLYGNSLSRVRMGPAWWDNPQDDPIPLLQAAELGESGDLETPPPDWLVADAMATWEMLENSSGGLANQGGIRGLVSEHGMHLGLVGETVLWGHTVNGVETYEALSVRELRQRSGKWEVTRRPDAKQGEPVGEDDLLVRIWRPHPGWSDLAHSSLRPLLDVGELLLLLRAGDMATARSRIANSGILYVDDTLDFGPADPTSDEPTDAPFIEELVAEAAAAIMDPASASATVPLVITGNGPLADRITWIKMERPLEATSMERAESALREFALSIDLPPELILGKGDLNHWTAWQVDEATAKVHIDPTCLLLDDGYANGYLRPRLAALGDQRLTPQMLRRLTVAHDLTALIVPPDRSGDAHRAYAELALGTEPYLRALGFDTTDLAEGEDLQRRLLIRAAIVLAQTTGQVPSMDDMEAGRLPPVMTPPAAPDVAARALAEAALAIGPRPSITAATPPDPIGGLGATLADLDAALLQRLEGEADQVLRRALEKAGARIVSAARRDTASRDAIRDVAHTHVAATLGRGAVARLGLEDPALLQDALEPLREVFAAQVGRTQQAALDAVEEAVGGLDAGDRREVEREQAEDRADAWAWLQAAATSYLLGLLYDPDPKAPEIGEHDVTSRVPFGMLREAVSRAGGASAGVARAASLGLDAAVVLAGRGTAAGVRLLNLLAANGIIEAALKWVYGPLPRATFEPHRALSGTVVSGPDDEQLTNASGWPSTSHYFPGDHRGCRCAWVPVLRRVER